MAIIRLACRHIHSEESKRDRYVVRAVLLDADTLGRSPKRDNEILTLARDEGLHLIWQRPCHEAFLLRHLPSCQHDRPPAGEAMNRLQKAWPGYRKGMPAMELRTRIGGAEVRQACAVESELHAFLTEIGFDPACPW